MKASEAIKSLTSLIDEHGDLDITKYDQDFPLTIKSFYPTTTEIWNGEDYVEMQSFEIELGELKIQDSYLATASE